MRAIVAKDGKQRIQLDMSHRAVERLDQIKEDTDASSRAEVIRNALAVYGYLLDRRAQGFGTNGILVALEDTETGRRTTPC